LPFTEPHKDKFTKESRKAMEGGWKITVHELFSHERGCRILTSFSVTLNSTDTLAQLFEAFGNSPENEDPRTSTNPTGLKPFDPKSIGRYDDAYGFKPTNPDGKTNCRWEPDLGNPKQTLAEMGLCDGAVLAYYTVRMRD